MQQKLTTVRTCVASSILLAVGSIVMVQQSVARSTTVEHPTLISQEKPFDQAQARP
jgi:hypothetical protein